ncbi:hypothetical protein J3F83DRAFT_541831 [Trichoderma novae-zelandiae]
MDRLLGIPVLSCQRLCEAGRWLHPVIPRPAIVSSASCPFGQKDAPADDSSHACYPCARSCLLSGCSAFSRSVLESSAVASPACVCWSWPTGCIIPPKQPPVGSRAKQRAVSTNHDDSVASNREFRGAELYGRPTGSDHASLTEVVICFVRGPNDSVCCGEQTWSRTHETPPADAVCRMKRASIACSGILEMTLQQQRHHVEADRAW